MNAVALTAIVVGCNFTITAIAALFLRRGFVVIAHILVFAGVAAPFVLIPAGRPCQTIALAWALAHVFSLHATFRILRHIKADDNGGSKSPRTSRFVILMESDIYIALHVASTFGFFSLSGKSCHSAIFVLFPHSLV